MKLEPHAQGSKQRASPSDLRLALGLIVLGYVYIVIVLAALLAGGITLARAVPALAQFVAQFGLIYVLIMIEALWVRVPQPSGKRVTRAGSPRLIQSIESVAARLDAPLPDTILVTGEFNAAAAELPRFGIFGPPRRYLLIGMPLLDALGVEETRAVIAHELAHLTRRHGRSRVLVARISTSWTALAMHIAAHRRYVAWLYLPFFRWYLPRLQAASDKLSRGHEHESDALAGLATNPGVMGSALLRMAVQRRRLAREFIRNVFARSSREARPPADLGLQVERFLQAPLETSALTPDVLASLEERTAEDDTHPSLSERLAALGISTEVGNLAQMLHDTASARGSASELLGEKRCAKLRAQLGPDFVVPFTERWRDLRSLVDVWQSPEGEKRAGTEAAVAHAKWAARTEPPPDAVITLHRARELAPEDHELGIQLAALLLEEPQSGGVEEAIPILEHEAASDSLFAFAACDLLRQALLRSDRASELPRIDARETELRESNLTTVRERSTVGAGDDLVAATLPEPALGKLVDWLKTKPEVFRAFLVIKRTEEFKDMPFYILALQRRVAWYKPESGRAGVDLCLQSLKVIDVGPYAHVSARVVEAGSSLLRKLRSIPGAAIVDRAPEERLSWVGKPRPGFRRPKVLPSLRTLSFGAFIILLVAFQFTKSSKPRTRGRAAAAPARWGNAVTPDAEAFGRRFVRLLESEQVDSIASLISATARQPDSVLWAKRLASAVPHSRKAQIERTLGLELHAGDVTRDILAYTVTAGTDTATVILGVVEELGVRRVERAEIAPGRVTPRFGND
jgi:Zn-dependent protease with chaperone function